MPRERMDEQQVSAYLRMDLRQVQRLASRGQIPCRRVGGRFVFTKVELDHWVEVQMHEMAPDRLRDIENFWQLFTFFLGHHLAPFSQPYMVNFSGLDHGR